MAKKQPKKRKLTEKDIYTPKNMTLSNGVDASKLFEKPHIKNILKPGASLKTVDMSKHYEDDKKRVEDDKIRYEKELAKEKKRFDNLPCPACKSKNKKRNIVTYRNGTLIVGGHNSVTKLADHLICQNCGIMYVDLNEKEIAKPYKGFYNLNRY